MTEPIDPKESSAASCDGGWKSFPQVAEKLATSRPYVTMLASRGELGEVRTSQDGKLRVATEAVEAYLAERRCEPASMMELQKAALAAGMYEIPEEQYVGSIHKK